MKLVSGTVLPSHRLAARDLIWRTINPADCDEQSVAWIAAALAAGFKVCLLWRGKIVFMRVWKPGEGPEL